MQKDIKKILVANRGEIALRIIQTCRDIGIKSVAVYSVADKDSLHVKFANEAVCIGEAPSSESYLNIERIISAVEITGADAIHPGYGFLSENPIFAKLCAKSGIIFIGPNDEIMTLLANKIAAKNTMKNLNVPIITGSNDIVKNCDEAINVAKKISFPVLLKAAFGGGGRGIVVVKNEDEIRGVWEKTRKEALESFGNGNIYVEKLIPNARHIEIQILKDNFGNIQIFPERDCSTQRRHKKIIEETPALISKSLRNKISFLTREALKKIKYTGAGTFEYIVDEEENFFFLEINTRIQVEHGITEVATDTDLIKKQIEIAQNKNISDIDKNTQCHVFEFRINAEDPEKDFLPSCGTITALHFPTGIGIRVDSHIYTGYKITPFYDSLLAKLIVKGKDRQECLMRSYRALNECIIEGIQTTIPFCLEYVQQALLQQ